MTDEFCVKCEQAIKTKRDLLGTFLKDSQSVQFKDGWYCERCAKLKVEEARRK